MKAAVISFPGSNCDFDMHYALQDFGFDSTILPASQDNLDDYDAIFLPGGFAYGDYLRTGAVARFANIMPAVNKAANQGKLIVGVCNGFQVLTEAGLLPGALLTNENPGFICDESNLEVVNNQTAFSNAFEPNEVVKIPVAHGEGNYYADEETLQALEDNNQIVFKYQSNLNGSAQNIAGITNKAGNVFGMMPHPERAVDSLLGNTAGRNFFASLVNALMKKAGIKA